jgi:hypothetical protein
MDLKAYYAKIRETAAKMEDEFPVIVSQEAGDGGKPGVFTETSRQLAAKALVEGKARIATSEEAAEFRKAQLARKASTEKAIAAKRIHVTFVEGSGPSAGLISKE